MTRDEALKILPEMKGCGSEWDTALDMAIEALQQPEIIYCKDCKFWKPKVGTKFDGLGECDFHKVALVTNKGYCFWAERRNDE